jgi:hypothetical protein
MIVISIILRTRRQRRGIHLIILGMGESGVCRKDEMKLKSRVLIIP